MFSQTEKGHPYYTVTQGAIRLLVGLVTLLYYRFFNFNTLKPIMEIEKYAAQPEKVGVLLKLLSTWRTRKRNELEFISIACIAVTAVVTASFAWSSVANAHWITQGMWFGSLTLSLCGILLSAQQISVLILLGDVPEYPQSPSASKAIQRYLPQLLLRSERSPARPSDIERYGVEVPVGSWTLRWKSVFIWQCPMMLAAYSIFAYVIGLTILVATPLIRGEPWGPASNIAIFYFAVFAVAWGIFIICSLLGYQRIDLDDEEETGDSNNPIVSEFFTASAMPEVDEVG